MNKKVLLINGPNLNLLGTREPETYGTETLNGIEQQLKGFFLDQQIDLTSFQSNSEGKIVDFLHQNKDAHFLIINPAAYTHTSIAIRDAILAVNIKFIEVHLSNTATREDFRKHSYFSDIAVGTVIGLGYKGYMLASIWVAEHLK